MRAGHHFEIFNSKTVRNSAKGGSGGVVRPGGTLSGSTGDGIFLIDNRKETEF